MSQSPTEEATRLELAVQLLRSRQERVTPARLAVLGVLDETREHLSAEEVVGLAAGRVPTVHRATVYRALATLGELGLVAHIHLGGSSTVYHLTVPGLPAAADHHVHLQCTRCGTVLDAPAEVMTALQSRLEQDQGFRLDPGHTALLGTCRACRSADG
ncbi:Fur family transcriptional regulator [uncultured Friedmanniella sp.]|uniref:Fur family transcriptional regulator n=1 Tax=uncultured Friedmanniella sp. TaxID=335381 RepID=UPI0035CC92AB